MSIHFLAALSFFCLRAACLETSFRTAAQVRHHRLQSSSASSGRVAFVRGHQLPVSRVVVTLRPLGNHVQKQLDVGRAGDVHSRIVLIRHGESESNVNGLFSWPGVRMTETGRQQAVRAGQTLRQKQFKFDQAFTTGFIRAQESLASVFEGFQERVPTIEAEELNTRTFGQLERLTIKQAAEKYSPQQVRWWYGTDFTNVPDNAPPGGETLRDCDTRAKSYYDKEIKPLVQAGKNILVVAHRNPIISIMSRIEGKSVEKTEGKWENAAPIVYEFNSAGQLLGRTVYDSKGNMI
ncbi:hypothetical protein PCASD_09401 [Puccinia coronata f. sp. avenae]|uniref:phosphoglycerate mutase (2,3-diphosphoglycerate-dependent) n=1 Tax=Puccinia coronata f. sp. avenae TaxID=200324 RepID=A0A2N5V193_9BASI|nr:hypothetical protein PCASD_09401 [Puccinia coronata f. sp. avenae]